MKKFTSLTDVDQFVLNFKVAANEYGLERMSFGIVTVIIDNDELASIRFATDTGFYFDCVKLAWSMAHSVASDCTPCFLYHNVLFCTRKTLAEQVGDLEGRVKALEKH